MARVPDAARHRLITLPAEIHDRCRPPAVRRRLMDPLELYHERSLERRVRETVPVSAFFPVRFPLNWARCWASIMRVCPCVCAYGV